MGKIEKIFGAPMPEKDLPANKKDQTSGHSNEQAYFEFVRWVVLFEMLMEGSVKLAYEAAEKEGISRKQIDNMAAGAIRVMLKKLVAASFSDEELQVVVNRINNLKQIDAIAQEFDFKSVAKEMARKCKDENDARRLLEAFAQPEKNNE